MATVKNSGRKNPPEKRKAKLPPVLQKTLDAVERLPKSEFRNVPKDFSVNLDHYLYGTPRR